MATIIQTLPEQAPSIPPEAETNENDVAIAAIEAEARVEIAKANLEADIIHSEVQQEIATVQAEAAVEAIQEQDTLEWRLNQLEQENAELRGQITALSAPPISLVEPGPTPLEAETQNLIPPSMPEKTSETLMEAIEESAAEGPAIPPLLEVKGGPVIRLV